MASALQPLSPVKAGFWYCKKSGQDIATTKAPIHFTHLLCAYADISPDYRVSIPAQYQHVFENFTRGAKDRNEGIKTLLSIGGVDSDPATFLSIISNKGNHEAFIQSSIQAARKCEFDGLHLSWPYWKYNPTPNDMENLGAFFSKWREAVNADAIAKNKERLLLTAAVSHSPNIINNLESASYPANAVIHNLDWINVRAYDLYNTRSSPRKTAPPAALHNATSPTNNSFKSVDTGISDWLRARVPANKLVIGLPFVGYEWLLEDARNHGIFALATGSANENGDGYISYQAINESITNSNFTHQFDEDYVTDYCYSGKNWIGYDGKKSIAKKIAYFQKKNLRGYCAWHVCADDPQWTLSATASKEWN